MLVCQRILTRGVASPTASQAFLPLRRCKATTPLPIATVGVVGCGHMGTGIAIVTARNAGLPVYAFDGFDASLEKSKTFVKDWAGKEIEKGRMTTAESEEFQAQIHYGNINDASALAVVPDLDFIVEAVNEELEIKHSVFKKIEEAGLRNDAIVGSNTNAISITKLGARITLPERFIGMHFMNPAVSMPLVEVIRGLRTSDVTHATTLELVSKMGKESATSKDRPGFIANRILMQNINAAIHALQDGIATKEDIDKIMKLGTNVPMGPLALADYIGLDMCLQTMRLLYHELGDCYRPASLLINYVEAGWLGVKTKRGFYPY